MGLYNVKEAKAVDFRKKSQAFFLNEAGKEDEDRHNRLPARSLRWQSELFRIVYPDSLPGTIVLVPADSLPGTIVRRPLNRRSPADLHAPAGFVGAFVGAFYYPFFRVFQPEERPVNFLLIANFLDQLNLLRFEPFKNFLHFLRLHSRLKVIQ